MVEFTEETKTAEITIQGIAFDAPEPYVEGHVLTENEASVLNQTLKENLRNNFAGTVKAAIETAGGIDSVDLEALSAAFLEYVENYEFGVRRAGSPRIIDPVEKEANKIAKQRIRDSLKAKGYKLSGEGSVPAAQITELAAKVLASDKGERIREIARQNLAAVEDLDLDSLDLGSSED